MNIKKHLTNWIRWFFTGNCLLYWLISLKYLNNIPWFDTGYLLANGKIALTLFITLAYIGQIGLLALSPCLLLIPLIYLVPKPKIIIPLAIVVATLIASFLVIDIAVWKLYRFHLNGVILEFVVSGLGTEILGISTKEILLTLGITLGFFFIEIILGFMLWRRILHKPLLPGFFKWHIAILGLCLYFSYSMLIYSSPYTINRVMVDSALLLPFYTQTLGALIPMKQGWKQVELLTEYHLVQPRKINAPLNYPLQPLHFQSLAKPLNIVFIVIDAWRFDMLNHTVTPNVTGFAKQSMVFTNHYSGGNSTGPGIFSLFYGLPSTYWTSMETQHKSPILIDELLKHHYQFGVFASAGLNAPNFKKVIFSQVPRIDSAMLSGNDPHERDIQVTNKFAEFMKKSSSRQPFFAFLFYDAAHSYCAFENPISVFKPVVQNCSRYDLTNETDSTGYFNRYKNALVFVDQEIKKDLDLLKKKGMFDNTIIIITGDHGEEFNDNHLNYWGHASNFTHFQVQTPLIVYWPGKPSKHLSHQTTHYDIAPTLTHDLFGCLNKPTDYSLGSHLCDVTPRPYLIIGNYSTFGIVQSHQIIDIYPSGGFRIETEESKPLPDSRLDISILRKAFGDIRRFYKQWQI